MPAPGESADFPALIPPMLAVPARELPAPEAEWAAEVKWDGVRAVAYVSAGGLRLVSRNGRDMTRAYPELAELAELAGQAGARRMVLDGEIVAFARGRPSFAGLQRRMVAREPAPYLVAAFAVTYLAFDIMYLDGQQLAGRPYVERRAILEALGLASGHVHVPPSFPGGGRAVRAVSIQQGLEGVVVKRLDSPYLPGRRSASWLKIKNRRVADVTVGGISPGQGERAGQIGSLLVGVPAGPGLVYAGRVGTGFTRPEMGLLLARLAPLRRDSPPFTTPVPAAHARNVIWVQPQLVIEVTFAEWTPGGILRAAAYRGMKVGGNRAGAGPLGLVCHAWLRRRVRSGPVRFGGLLRLAGGGLRAG
ncbi:MAG TPA: non-homologous end-joining DNA ligase [Streptosporangiaceae bacterium]